MQKMAARRSRALAWILAVCMLAGLLPAYAAESPDELMDGFTILSLDFRSEYQKPAEERGGPMDATLEKNGWQVNTERTAASLTGGGSAFSYEPYGIAAAVNDAGYPKHAELTLDFQVEAGGLYSVEMTGGQDPETGVNAAVYVDGVYLGSYDFGAGAQAQTIGARAELSEITLAQGTHSVTFRRLSGGERANNRMMPGCVTFKRIGAARAEANLNFVALWDQNYAQGLTRSPLDATLGRISAFKTTGYWPQWRIRAIPSMRSSAWIFRWPRTVCTPPSLLGTRMHPSAEQRRFL